MRNFDLQNAKKLKMKKLHNIFEFKKMHKLFQILFQQLLQKLVHKLVKKPFELFYPLETYFSCYFFHP